MARGLRGLPRRRRRVVVLAALLALLAGLLVWNAWPRSPGYVAEPLTITVRTGPGETTPVALDATYYWPRAATAAHPTAAVLLAHGFGQTKESLAPEAEELADRGYAALTWSAEGFGRSGGQIHVDSPDWEVRDAEQLVSWLAARPEIIRDAPGDPRVGVMGASYGGALALLLAGYDRRVDAVVAEITWNDLADAFFPEATGAGPQGGVFKKAWAGLFFGDTAGASVAGSGLVAGPQGPTCGRFAPDECRAYLSVATTGRPTPDQIALLRRSSPASVLAHVTAPTLLVQGEEDSLFPLSQADANARGIAAQGTPVQVAWVAGGHDGGAVPQSDLDRMRFLTVRWLDHYLLRRGGPPGDAFTYSRVAGVDASNGGVVAAGYSASRYPGLAGQATIPVGVGGPPRQVVNPPDGTPSAVSLLPGLPGGDAPYVAHEVPGQHADFLSAPLSYPVDEVGAPTVQLRAASPTGEAVLFVKLYDVDPAGGATLPEGLVAPVRLRGLPASIAAARPVTVTLPAVVHEFPAGHRLRVTVATTDQAYMVPADPAVYTVAAGPTVEVPTIRGAPIASSEVAWRWALAGLAAALALGLALAVWVGRRRRGREPPAEGAGADLPLRVEGLRKEFADGLVAVREVSFSVARGQVVGLLGPNGAGKTTVLRALLGLVQPSAGTIHVFGHRLVPGAPVLSRLGALVEGPGFLPHLSGLANLQAHWRATGRPEIDARFEEALCIAGLGDAIQRRVRTYSHGMKQRLAVAQAMLGLPDLLVLDEPTDGLDPPQIAEMRSVLVRYATEGRAVLVSSHLLAEVERTCTNVVVLHRGAVVASGPVAEVVGDSPSVRFDVSDPEAAARVLRGCGARDVDRQGAGTLVADLDGTPSAAAVAALVRAGVEVHRVVPRRRLEDAFLALVGEARSGAGGRAEGEP